MNVIITGASRGLGLAMAEAFAKEGHNLYLTSRNEVNLYQTLASFQERFPDQIIKAKAFNLGLKTGALEFGQWVLGSAVHADVLINNAGIFEPGRVVDEPEGQMERMINTNFLSAYYVTRSLLPSMMERRSGHIFNMSSIAALQAYPNGGSYSVSKFALTGFSKNLREELKPYSIKVTCIYPGAVYTDSWAAAGISPDRIMKASDIADTVVQITKLSPQAVVEDLVIRPLAGDL
ncbi:MAG TPA: SDR family oxidoreductase [Puia sp.]|jgi:short-subunit dehydrogenase|nr:SDR family oxidoreductase [Puia sp.]